MVSLPHDLSLKKKNVFAVVAYDLSLKRKNVIVEV